MIVVKVRDRDIKAAPMGPVTTGSVGLPVRWEFSEEWTGLAKTAVFRGSNTARDVFLTSDECTVPAEVLTAGDGPLEIGVRGVQITHDEDSDEDVLTVVIPTIWGRIERIFDGTVPSQVDPSVQEPDWTDQVKAAAAEALSKATAVEQAAARGDFNGKDGASAYDQAVAGAYAGTEAQFNEALASFKELSEHAEDSANMAAGAAFSARNYERNASDAESAARSYADIALIRMNSADASAQDAEAYAVGKRKGNDVGSTDPAYHNNSKYYAEQAGETVNTFTGTTVPAAVQSVNAAGQTQVGAVNTAGQTQTQAVNTAGQTALTAVSGAQTTAVAAVQTESATQQAAIQQKGEDVLDSIPSDYTELTEDVDELKSAFSEFDSKVNETGNYIDLTVTEGVYINVSTGSPLLSGAVSKASNIVSFDNATFGGDKWCMFLTGKTLATFNWNGYYKNDFSDCYVDAIPKFVIGHLYRIHCAVIEGTYTLDNPLAGFTYLGLGDRNNHRILNLFNNSVWKCGFIPQIVGAFVRKGTYNCKISYYIEDITESYKESVPETKNLLQIFDKITAIGDSLTAGYTGSTTPAISSNAAKARGANWPTYIGSDIGRSITNLAVGNSSWKDWRYGTGSADITTANIDTNCYLVGLGINDSIDDNTVGTSADIATNKSDNADSVYGNADFVVRTLHEYNPGAHIFLLTIPVVKTNYKEINEALRYIASMYDYAHCVDLYEYFNDYNYGIIPKLVSDGVHYEPIGYRILASYIETAVNTFMFTNYDLFLKVPYEL